MRLAKKIHFLFSTQFIGFSHSVPVLRLFNKRKINAVHWYSYPMVKSLLYTPRLNTIFAIFKYISVYFQALKLSDSNFRLQRNQIEIDSLPVVLASIAQSTFLPFSKVISIRICRRKKAKQRNIEIFKKRKCQFNN